MLYRRRMEKGKKSDTIQAKALLLLVEVRDLAIPKRFWVSINTEATTGSTE